MKVDMENVKIEDICKEKGALRHDGKKLTNNADAFNVKEFTFVFYGHSKCQKSRQIAYALNNYADYFNDEDGGLKREKLMVGCRSTRIVQIFYIPCEKYFIDFQSFYTDYYESGWIYPDFPNDIEDAD